MGMYGFLLNVGDNKVNFSSIGYDNITHNIYNNLNWLYTNVETLYAYDFKVTYFWLLNSIFDESIDFFILSI